MAWTPVRRAASVVVSHPLDLAVLLVAIPRWGGRLNVLVVRPDEPRALPFVEAMLMLAYATRLAARVAGV